MAGAVVALAVPSAWGQVGAIVLGGIVGIALLRDGAPTDHASLPLSVSRTAAVVALAFFFALLIGLPLAVPVAQSPALAYFDAFYRAGSLVFGGGHVVLPLLQAEVVPETFQFVGFVFICGRTRKGKFQLKRKTRRDRMRAKLKKIKAELRERMHQRSPNRDDGWRKSSEASTTTTPCRRICRHCVLSGMDAVPGVVSSDPKALGARLVPPLVAQLGARRVSCDQDDVCASGSKRHCNNGFFPWQ